MLGHAPNDMTDGVLRYTLAVLSSVEYPRGVLLDLGKPSSGANQ